VAFAAAAGPPLGGVLVSLAGWRAIFYVNLLLVVPALLLGWRTIPTRSAREFERTFDLAGAVLLLIILMGMAGLLTQSRNGEVSPALLLTGGLILIGVAAFFLWYEWRHPDPVLQPRFFRQRSFAAANGAVCLSNLAMYSTLLTIPILLTGAGGRSSIETGLVLAALMVSSVVLSPIGGRLADRWGRRWPTVGGLSLLTFGLLLLALTAERGMLPVMVGSLSLAGVGLGLSMAGMQTAAVESVRAEEAGVASGVYSTSRYLGSITGSSVLAGLLAPTPAGSGGFGAVFLMVAVAALLSTCLSLGLHDRPPTVDHPLSHQDDLIGAARTGKPVT
jgi:MFS family permease